MKSGSKTSNKKTNKIVQSEKTKVFINKARLKHGDKYDYSKVDYMNNRTPVKIICPNHKVFEQKPRDHLIPRGCKECGKKSTSDKSIRLESMRTYSSNFNYEAPYS
jgi:hypothetical protein